jgi:hypothetical protein
VIFVLSILLGQSSGKHTDHQTAAHTAAVVEGAHLALDSEGAALLQRGESVKLLTGDNNVKPVFRLGEAANCKGKCEVFHTVVAVRKGGRGIQTPPE